MWKYLEEESTHSNAVSMFIIKSFIHVPNTTSAKTGINQLLGTLHLVGIHESHVSPDRSVHRLDLIVGEP